MDEFIGLLVDAVKETGSVALLAERLDTEPSPVYGWLAGNYLPTGDRLRELTQRLRRIAKKD
jgi:hypothetical protein